MGGVERVVGKGVYGIDLMLKDQLHGGDSAQPIRPRENRQHRHQRSARRFPAFTPS